MPSVDAQHGAGGNDPAERWLCEQLQRSKFDLTTRVLPSRHRPGYEQPRGPFEDYDLHYIDSGAVEYAFAQKTIRAQAGEFCLLGPGLKFTERNVNGRRSSTLIYVHFTIETAGRNPLDVLELPAVVRSSARSGLTALCRETLRDSERSSNGVGWTTIAMKGKFIALLGAVLEEGFRSGALRLDAGRLGPDWLWTVLRKIDAEMSSSALTLPALAASASLSPSHFTHQFTKYMGLSPMQFLMQRRMALACDLLLAKQDMSIKEIAQRCGFSDPYHFSAQFKRQVRQSPSSFRVRH
ncbi:MAG TPA: helix-turn-helix transcriptional regulator [Planctomycetota bacterium]|nr:helix-turn-helix transcriptional regulator [Planctomycetota bacterium]